MRMWLAWLCVLVILCAEARGEVAVYHWPMATKPALTSTFGEYRSGGRFHAGLDLKTWGQEGIPVLAVADGYVWRVRTSPWGYGKAVYLRLVDGRTAVYAHLSGFVDRISGLVEAEQERAGTYSVNLYLKAGQVGVARGDTVAFSGSTGTGVPHLHFEVRDGAQRPLNALLNGFEVADTMAPTLKALALVPLDADARAAGDVEPWVAGMRWDEGRREYGVSGRVTVSGRVGVGVEVYDRADASALTNRLAPYRLRLLVDGSEVFQTTYRAFSYDQVYQLELDRNFVLKNRGYGVFHNLFLEEGNTLPLYGRYQSGDGVLWAGPGPGALAQGVHRIQVVAEDGAGNRAVGGAEVLVDAPPEVLDARAVAFEDSVMLWARVLDGDGDTLRVVFEDSADGGASWRSLGTRVVASGGEVSGVFAGGPGAFYRVRAVDPFGLEAFQTCGPAVSGGGPADSALVCDPVFYPGFAVVRVRADRSLAGPPEVVALREGGGEAQDVRVMQKDVRAYEALVWFEPGGREAVVEARGVELSGREVVGRARLVQEPVEKTGGAVVSEDGVARAQFGPDGVYGRFFGRAEGFEHEGEANLPLLGLAYRFSPADVPFKSPAELSLRFPDGFERPEQLGVYELDGEGKWAFVGNRLDAENGTVAAEVRHFSTYGLLLDRVPPEVDRVQPAEGAEVADRRPVLQASLRDVGSGIGREEDIVMVLDGHRMIAEYDPERELVRARPRTPLLPGAHRLEVRVRDLCGNETQVVRVFQVR